MSVVGLKFLAFVICFCFYFVFVIQLFYVPNEYVVPKCNFLEHYLLGMYPTSYLAPIGFCLTSLTNVSSVKDVCKIFV